MKRVFFGVASAVLMMFGVAGFNALPAHAQYTAGGLNATTSGTFTFMPCGQYYLCASFHGTGFSQQVGFVTDNGTFRVSNLSNGLFPYATGRFASFQSTLTFQSPYSRARGFEFFQARSSTYTFDSTGTVATFTASDAPYGFGTVSGTFYFTNFYSNGSSSGTYTINYNGGAGSILW